MRGENIQPEEGGEPIAAINPDEENSVVEAPPADGDPFAAAELNAVKEFASTDDEATEEEVVPEEVAADPQTEPDQSTEEAPVEVVPEDSPKSAWDGNPDNLPDELQDTYKTMLRGFHSKTRDLADAKKETERLQAELLLRVTDGKPAEAAPPQPPPLPTGDNITQEQWNDAVTAQNAWYAEQNRTAMLSEMEKSDRFVSSDQFADIQRQAEVSQLEAEIKAMPGFSPEVETLMLEKATESTFWANALTSKEGAFTLARMAIDEVVSKTVQTEAAAKEAAKIQKQATAASRATPRISSPAGAAPEDVFAKNLEMSENEKMEMSERLVREEYSD